MRYKEEHIDCLEKSPKKVPHRLNVKNNKTVVRKDSWDSDTPEKERNFYNVLERFLRSNIGRNIDKVFSDFCKKFPEEKIGWINPQAVFWDHVNKDYWYFYIDSQKRLQFDKKRYDKHHTRKDFVVNYGDSIRMFKIDLDFLKKHPEIPDDLVGLVGYDIVDRLFSGEIDEKTYCKLTTNKCLDYYSQKANEIWGEKNKVWSRYQKKYVSYYNWTDLTHKIFKEYWVYDGGTETYDRKSTDFRQVMAEIFSQRKKEERGWKKADEEKKETLLHDIVEEKKIRERKKNLVDRDRLGFDDKSFIGEPYHGQKRKKEKKNENS